ncbi:MAG: hypothetical protein AABZ12_03615 [Planctomycetota bacterium]
MAATPQYGGTNGVPEVNLGQPGSARAAGNTARFTLRVLEGSDQAIRVPQAVVQQNVTFADNLGFREGEVEWAGTLRVDTPTTLDAVRNELNRYKHGSARVSGALTAPDPTYMRPTKLTDSFGNVLSLTAQLAEWSFTTPVNKLHQGGYFLYAVGLRVRFKLLG